MSIVKRFSDGLANVVANLGTSRDKSAHTTYIPSQLSPQDLNTIYRESWVARDGVNFPAEDSIRHWRTWRGDVDQIQAIEALERKLQLKSTLLSASKKARLYGGAAIYINTGESRQSEPLKPGEEIRSLVVLTRNELSPERTVRDIDSEYYGRSEYYTITSGQRAQQVRIHATRLVLLGGDDPLTDSTTTADCSVWGDSVLQAAHDALTQRDSVMANIASLVFEAKVDVFRFAGFADMLQDNQDDAIIKRAHLQAAMKGINGAVVIDMQDEYEQKTASFSGLTEISSKFQEEVAGAFGIPVRRFFGRSTAGLSDTGDGDERVYYDRIGQDQRLRIGPALAHLDECMITQALGDRPEGVSYTWAPLRQMTEGDRAEILSKTANAARALAGTQAGEVLPLDALSDALVNALVDMGALPGLEQAIETYGSLYKQNGGVE